MDGWMDVVKKGDLACRNGTHRIPTNLRTLRIQESTTDPCAELRGHNIQARTQVAATSYRSWSDQHVLCNM